MVHRTLLMWEILWEISKFVSIRNLLDSSKKFKELKLKLIYLKLNPFYSEQYYYDNVFRDRVLSQMLNPEKQLSINLRGKKIVDVSNLGLGLIHTLDLSYCKKITDKGTRHLANVKTLVR